MRLFSQDSQILFFFGIGLMLFIFPVHAQETIDYDELIIELSAPRIGEIEMPVAIKGQAAYISVTDLFDAFKLKNEYSSSEGLVTGFIISPDSAYKIDLKSNEIIYRDQTYPLSGNDYIKTPTTLYLRSELFGNIFGLETDFSFRRLAVDLKTDLDLPLFKQ